MDSGLETIALTSVQNPAVERTGPSSLATTALSGEGEIQQNEFKPVQSSPAPPLPDNATTPAPVPPILQKSSLWFEARDHILQSKDADDWKKFQDDLKPSDEFSIDIVLETLHEKKTAIEEDQLVYVMQDGKRIIFRDVIDKMIGWAGAFKDIGTAVAAFDPTKHAGLAWGSVQVLVTVSLLYFHFKYPNSLLTCYRLQ